MFNFNNTPHADALDKAIADLLEELDGLNGSAEEYTATANNLAKLMELKNQIIKTGNETTKIELDANNAEFEKVKFAADQEKLRSWKPSPDAIVSAAASVLAILAILQHEKFNVITSKAIGFVGRGLK